MAFAIITQVPSGLRGYREVAALVIAAARPDGLSLPAVGEFGVAALPLSAS